VARVDVGEKLWEGVWVALELMVRGSVAVQDGVLVTEKEFDTV